MLGEHGARDRFQRVWQSLNCTVELPEKEREFFRKQGLMSLAYDDRRRHPRVWCRGKAILEHEGLFYAVYTNDLSRSGISFLHAAQLFPCETVRLHTLATAAFSLTIVRCRRLNDCCYACSCTFAEPIRGSHDLSLGDGEIAHHPRNDNEEEKAHSTLIPNGPVSGIP